MTVKILFALVLILALASVTDAQEARPIALQRAINFGPPWKVREGGRDSLGWNRRLLGMDDDDTLISSSAHQSLSIK